MSGDAQRAGEKAGIMAKHKQTGLPAAYSFAQHQRQP